MLCAKEAHGALSPPTKHVSVFTSRKCASVLCERGEIADTEHRPAAHRKQALTLSTFFCVQSFLFFQESKKPKADEEEDFHSLYFFFPPLHCENRATISVTEHFCPTPCRVCGLRTTLSEENLLPTGPCVLLSPSLLLPSCFRHRTP